MSYLSVGTVPLQSDVLNSALSPVVYGDIALSIKINTHPKKKFESATSEFESEHSNCYTTEPSSSLSVTYF